MFRFGTRQRAGRVSPARCRGRCGTGQISARRRWARPRLILAPFDGVVLTKTGQCRRRITPLPSATECKGAVVTIADMDTLEVEADVSESAIGRIKVGQPCEIQLDAIPGERFASLVSRTVPTVDRAKATVLVKVRFAARDARVLPDMSAKVAFLDQGSGCRLSRRPGRCRRRRSWCARAGPRRALGAVSGSSTGEQARLIPVQRWAASRTW
ncbi:MAG: efflux RND transporter periplasmic adaptor subunit [Propionivibrio sp.]|nr:efflux RND transporter periplasmic adaptor subunit [Propionivibrio sp.]